MPTIPKRTGPVTDNLQLAIFPLRLSGCSQIGHKPLGTIRCPVRPPPAALACDPILVLDCEPVVNCSKATPLFLPPSSGVLFS